jgi:hypothetical protein
LAEGDEVKVSLPRTVFVPLLSLVSVLFHGGDARSGEVLSGLGSAEAILRSTSTGKAIWEAAHDAALPLIPGKVSRTEVTATRHLHEGNETIHFETRVIISGTKSPVFQALDLAHELVHALRPKENPFQPGLDPGTYILRGIEGEGGEAEAIRTECRVGKEIADSTGSSTISAEDRSLIRARCGLVWNLSANEAQWTRSFYRLGNHYREFMRRYSGIVSDPRSRQHWFQRTDPGSPFFTSAVAQKPYPLALLEEYLEITRKLCEKTQRKTPERHPAEEDAWKGRCSVLGRSG